MRIQRVLGGLATAAILLAATAACADDGNDPAASGSPTPSSPAPTTATTTPPSDTEVASEAASDVVRRYFATVDQLRQDPDQPSTELNAVTISTQLSAQKKLLESQRTDGRRQVGDTQIVELTVQAINLDNSDPQAGKVPTVQVDVCFDVSEVDVLDANEKSVVSPDRPDTGWIRFLVSNYEWAGDPKGGWRVASGQDLEQAPCAAS